MSVDPKEDPTALGNILLEWGLVDQEELNIALEEQRSLRGDDLLGKLLIANGACAEEDIEVAMSAQASMRSVSKAKQAMAVADIALARQRRDSVFTRRARMQESAKRLQRTITGDEHPALTPEMLAEKS